MLKLSIYKQLAGFTLDANFTSDAGITALFGRSGAGKTTVVNCIAGLLQPQRGTIEINGECLFDGARGIDVAVEQRRVGYVFQEGRLFPHLTVRGNLEYGYRLSPTGARAAGFEQVVELLGIAHLLDRRPAALSGGEKQRVAIGRALLSSPRVLLMDEPLAALDHARKDEILAYIERLHREIRVPIIYVTHAVEEIVRLAQTVVVMAGGSVIASGRPEQVMGRPELRTDSGIFEGGALVEATVAAHDFAYDLTTLEFSGGTLIVPGVAGRTGDSVRVRIRARDVSLALVQPTDISVLNVLQGRVSEVLEEADGSASVTVDVGGAMLVARITRYSVRRLGVATGIPVFALIKAVSLDRRGPRAA